MTTLVIYNVSMSKKFDTLSRFHMQNPDFKAYEQMARLLQALENEQEDIATDILDETNSPHIIQLLCNKTDVDLAELYTETQIMTRQQISPRLLLHIIFLSLGKVSNELEIDYDETFQILQHLKSTFTIDDPILWLKRFLEQCEQEHLKLREQHHKLMHGLEVVNQPLDTAEERRVKERNQLHHHLKRFFRSWF